jgi:glycosyltransferase involved in cell wall biosynthesis
MQSLNNNITKTQPGQLDEGSKRHLVAIAIIPAHNESENIGKIVSETSKYVSVVIVVDDGSSDNTAQVADSLNAKVVRHKHNTGKGAALKRGLIECLKYNPDVVITLDGDGQHDPADIPKLLEPIENEEADIVIGSRYGRGYVNMEMPRYRRIGLSFIYFMNRNLINTKIKDTKSGYRVYTKNIVSIMSRYSSTGFGAETEQLTTAELYGLRILEIPISIRYKGLRNTSQQNAFLHGMRILSTILDLAVEKRPLLFFGLSGVILMVAAIITTVIVAQYYAERSYFSIPLTLVALAFVLLGFMLILMSLVLYELKRIAERWNARY